MLGGVTYLLELVRPAPAEKAIQQTYRKRMLPLRHPLSVVDVVHDLHYYQLAV
jgi:hypothetical protein